MTCNSKTQGTPTRPPQIIHILGRASRDSWIPKFVPWNYGFPLLEVKCSLGSWIHTFSSLEVVAYPLETFKSKKNTNGLTKTQQPVISCSAVLGDYSQNKQPQSFGRAGGVNVHNYRMWTTTTDNNTQCGCNIPRPVSWVAGRELVGYTHKHVVLIPPQTLTNALH